MIHTEDTDKAVDDEKSLATHKRIIPTKVESSLSPSEKELRNVILKANAVDAEYFTPVVSEYFESYRKKKKAGRP